MDNGKMAEDRAGQQTANDGKADKSSKTDKDTASMNPLLDSDKTNKAGKSSNKNRKEQKKVNVEKTDDNDDKEKSDGEPLSLSEVIKEQATEEESPLPASSRCARFLAATCSTPPSCAVRYGCCCSSPSSL